jgi:uncharacterized protein
VSSRRSAWRIVWPSFVLALAGCTEHGCQRSPPANAPQPARSTVSAAPDPALVARLAAGLVAKGPDYIPRTRHKKPDGSPKYTNRLVLEASPYLLQHAHNPVDWFPWGDEAFARAKALGRPVFLSVGYSTCHWCHVMEEESFEDEEIAHYLNEHYVAIKVDREERPDVDAVYMSFLQSLTGGGGWPMNVWLTPTREPFFGGTYFPPRAGVRGSRRGFLEVLRREAERMVADPSGVTAEAQTAAGKLRAASTGEASGDLPGASALFAARAQAKQRFDTENGGSRGAPKFPSSFPSRLLLRVGRRASDPGAREMATSTLLHMRAGGIYDQLAGGFHRYATDPRWAVPHFEKMLYDNALRSLEYLEGAQASGDPALMATTRETLDYVLREMTSPAGVFFSATDADSPVSGGGGRREEGLSFTWTPGDLRAVLGEPDGELAAAWFGVTEHGPVGGRSVLQTVRKSDVVAAELGLTDAAFQGRLATVKTRLLAARDRRPQPLRDEKILVAWNALMVSALARTALVLGEQRYAEAAVRAATVLVAPHAAGQPWPHQIVADAGAGAAFADDLVFLASACLDVFELTAEPRWLDQARAAMTTLEGSFVDTERGGYFLTAVGGERLLLREKPDYDGAIPSANSAAALVLHRLHTFTSDDVYRARAERTLRALGSTIEQRPLGLSHALLAVDWATDRPKEIVIVVPAGRGALAAAARPFVKVLAEQWVPNAVLVVATEAELAGDLGRALPFVRDKGLRGGKPTAYVCERGACQLPTTEPLVFAGQLGVVAYP